MRGSIIERLRRRAMVALLPASALIVLSLASDAHAESRIVVRESARRLVAVSPGGGRTQTLVHLHRGAILGTAASRGGGVIAFASRTFHKVRREGGVQGERLERQWTDRVWVIGAGDRPHVVRTIISRGGERAYKPIDSIALSPDGRRLVIEKRHGAVFLMATDGSALHQVRPAGYGFGVGGGRNSSGPEFTPDGRRLIGIFYPPTHHVTDIGGIGTVALDGGPVHFLRRGPFVAEYGYFDAPTISPDGRHVAFVSSGGGASAISMMNRDGSDAHRLKGTVLPGWDFGNPSFSPSGRSLTLVGVHPGTGNTVIGRTPSVLFTIGLDGAHLREVQSEKAHLFKRDPIWVRWAGR